MSKHGHKADKHDRHRKRARSSSPSSRHDDSVEERSPKRRRENPGRQDDILERILEKVENLSSRVSTLEASSDERDSISVFVDEHDLEDLVPEPAQTANASQAPVEPIQAPVESIQTSVVPSGESQEEKNLKNTSDLYDPEASSQAWKASTTFLKFLETNFRRKLSYDQVQNILENWSSPSVEALMAPKADPPVLNQVPAKVKKFVQERDKEMFTVQRAMLNSTAPLCSLHDLLESGNLPSVEDIKSIIQQSLCLLGSANHQLSSLRRQRILASINRAKINLADQPLPNAKTWLFGDDFPTIASKQADLSRGLAKNLSQPTNKNKSKYNNNSHNGPKGNSSSASKYQSGSSHYSYQGSSQKYQFRPKNRPFRPSKGRQADSQDA